MPEGSDMLFLVSLLLSFAVVVLVEGPVRLVADSDVMQERGNIQDVQSDLIKGGTVLLYPDYRRRMDACLSQVKYKYQFPATKPSIWTKIGSAVVGYSTITYKATGKSFYTKIRSKREDCLYDGCFIYNVVSFVRVWNTMDTFQLALCTIKTMR